MNGSSSVPVSAKIMQSVVLHTHQMYCGLCTLYLVLRHEHEYDVFCGYDAGDSHTGGHSVGRRELVALGIEGGGGGEKDRLFLAIQAGWKSMSQHFH